MEKVTLASLCARISSGGTPSRSHPEYFTTEGGHRWVKSQELVDRPILDTDERISDLGLQNSSAKYYDVNTVLIAMYGATVGQLAILRVPATVNQAICALSVDPTKADYRYVFYALMATRRDLVVQAAGAAQQNLNQGLIRDFAIPIFPLDIQRRIAAILESFDDLIDNIRRRIAILEETARLIYREWFVHFRVPGQDTAPAESIGMVPVGWAVGNVQDVIILQRGFDLPIQERDESGAVPVLAASGPHGMHSESKVRGPGVVTGRSGTIGVVTYVAEDFWPLNTVLWVKEYRRSTPRHAYFLLESLELPLIAGGAAVPTLNRNHVHALPIAVPPTQLIEEFDAVVAPMFFLVGVLREEARILGATRDLLLPRLVSGELDVLDLDLELEPVA